jgi:hypothetical protein
LRGRREKQERKFPPARGDGGNGAGAAGNVQDHRVVSRIKVVAVSHPVAGVNMKLDIPAEQNTSDADQRFAEIRPAIVIRSSP